MVKTMVKPFPMARSSPRPAHRPIVIFDGDCALCNRQVALLTRIDKQHLFQVVGGRTAQGRALAGLVGCAHLVSATVIVVTENRTYTQSSAILQILAGLPRPWRWLSLLQVVPRPIRDWVYRLVARYRRGGQPTFCTLPSEHK